MVTKKYSKYFIESLLLFCLASVKLSAQKADDILGKWHDISHPEKKLEIFAHSGKYYGKAISRETEPNNGIIILKDLEWNTKTKSFNGQVINPDNGNAFKTELRLTDSNTFQFTVGFFILSKRFTFKRIIK